MRNPILLGECAGYADSRRNCIDDGRVAHAVAEQLDGNATHAGTALEKCCFVESNEGSDDLDQLLCAPGEPMFAEPSRFRARESLTEAAKSNPALAGEVARLDALSKQLDQVETLEKALAGGSAPAAGYTRHRTDRLG